MSPVVDEPVPAAEQMARDAALARGPLPGARFFRWDPPAVSLGWKQPRPDWLFAEAWRRSGLEAVERPTGGGIAFHGSDVSVAVALPRIPGESLDAILAAVGDSAVALCRAVGVRAAWDARRRASRIVYCLAEVSPYAVLVDGRKVAGFSLRRFPDAWLVEGSLLVRPLPQPLERAVPAGVVQELRARAVSLEEAAGRPLDEHELAGRWARHWEESWNA